MTDGERILVVDDEAAIVKAVSAGLAARGYRATAVATGEAAVESIAHRPVDLIILDLGLPDIDGVEVCRRIRLWSDVPILILSAEGSEERKILALDEGADDYVTKPFSMPELLARVRVALRNRRPASRDDDRPVLECGDVEIDLARRTVRVGAEAITLTRKEFDFLAALARYPGRVLTHRTILQEVWGPDYGTEVQYLRVYASQLRKKLGDDPEHPRLMTAPGVGYRLVDRTGDPDPDLS